MKKKKKIVIGAATGIVLFGVGLGSLTAYNIEQDKQEQIRIKQIEKKKEEARKKAAKEKAEKEAQEKLEKEKLEKEKAEKKKAEEQKKAEEARKKKAEEDKQKAEEELRRIEEAKKKAEAEEAAFNEQQRKEQEQIEQNNEDTGHGSEDANDVEPVEEVVDDATSKEEVSAYKTSQTSSSYEDFIEAGVINSGGYKYTYYSQSVLPGGGLNIPGRHVSGGFVRDENEYIVLANDAPKGTIIETPFGVGMVYDRGTYGSHIDIYVQ